jgi:hypothetical protein
MMSVTAVMRSRCPEDVLPDTHARLYTGNPDHRQLAYFPNLIMSLRVSVTWSVTMAGPPLYMCQAAYCSM